ncbi:MAG TPA: methylmalonyl-CoA mutase family protein [Chloroflexota bacterium]|nr:methylmalonyl-CoA mutase family protein [Chloroflexota bacterium]
MTIKDERTIESQSDEWRQAYGHDREERFSTVSDQPVEPLYSPLDRANEDFAEDIGFPGSFPFTRGIYSNMHRGRLWTMRQFAGFGSARETNQRFHYLLRHGSTGLSVAFDNPTLMAIDSDDPRSQGEVGRTGVAIDSLADMEALFEGIPLDQVSTSMTINAPANVLFAMYIAVGEKQGVAAEKLSGTNQNDILKEYIAQKEWVYPPDPSVGLVVDSIEYASQYVPRWNPVSISGYHIREAGSTAVQELAFTVADGMQYVESAMARGLDVDSFAPRLSFFWNSHIDFFEEIAKFRAARRMWARLMRYKYGAKNPRSWLMRFHTQTAGVSLTLQQPENNIVRTALEALAAVLGGTQSLHTNSMDEVYALPTEKAVQIALRTQQVIAHESGVVNTVDPLGGSYFVETLTDRMEEAAHEYFARIDELGGVIAGIEEGFFQREIADAAFHYQQQLDRHEKTIVGVNEFVTPETDEIPLLKIDPEVERGQVERLRHLKERRDNDAVDRRLHALSEAVARGENSMPYILEAVRSYATVGEVTNAMKSVFGTWREPVFV